LKFSGISSPTTAPLAKKVTDSINCEELAAATYFATPGPDPQQELDWCVFVRVGISLIDKSTHWGLNASISIRGLH